MPADPVRALVRLRLPRWPLAPLVGVIVMAAVAAASNLLWQQTGWPGFAPLSSIGHGLTAGMLVVIAIQVLVCSREARLMEAGHGEPSLWMKRALACPTDARQLAGLRAEASGRWALLFLLGFALVPLGLVASLEQLPSPGWPVPVDLKPYLPLGLALLEAVIVVLAARALDGQWEDFVTSWSCFAPPAPQEPPPVVEEKTDSLEDLFGASEPMETATPPPTLVPLPDEPPVEDQAVAKQFWWPTVK